MMTRRTLLRKTLTMKYKPLFLKTMRKMMKNQKRGQQTTHHLNPQHYQKLKSIHTTLNLRHLKEDLQKENLQIAGGISKLLQM